MASTSTHREIALSTKLCTIAVTDIQLGMVVHAIAEQAGTLGVKNKGKVKSLNIIQQLSAQGVVSVIVEPLESASLKNNDTLHKLQQQKNKRQAQFQARANASNSVDTDFIDASKLVEKSNLLHKQYATLIQRDVNVDFAEAQAVVSSVYERLTKRPEALLCLSMMMHSSDYLANHAIHVATLLCHFAHFLGMNKAECERIALVGYLFDIGMVKVDLSIREKQGALSPDEQNQMRQHVAYSLQIVENLGLDQECLLAIEQHHERLDGSGYPNAYTSSKIHKYSRMLAIADSYDALTTTRPHQLPLSPAGAMKVLSNPDNGYDQKLVLQFIKCLGIYPVGSLVALSNMHIGLVTKTNRRMPTLPEVKIFYSIRDGQFLSPTTVDLADEKNQSANANKLRVIKPIIAAKYGINVAKIL